MTSARQAPERSRVGQFSSRKSYHGGKRGSVGGVGLGVTKKCDA